MALYVRIQNNAVTDCWDTPPPAGQDGWKSAVEVRPAITAHRQGYTAHTFDLTKDPVQIVYGTYDIPVEDRKAGMKANASFSFQQVVQDWTNLNRTPNEYYFIFDTRDKIPNEYFIDIKVTTSGQVNVYKQQINFLIVNQKEE